MFAPPCTHLTPRLDMHAHTRHRHDDSTPHQRQWQCLLHGPQPRCSRPLQHRHDDRTPTKSVAVPYPWRCDRPLQHPPPTTRPAALRLRLSLVSVTGLQTQWRRKCSGFLQQLHSVGGPLLAPAKHWVVFQWTGTAGGTHQRWLAHCPLCAAPATSTSARGSSN